MYFSEVTEPQNNCHYASSPVQSVDCLFERELIYNNPWLICKETNHEASAVY